MKTIDNKVAVSPSRRMICSAARSVVALAWGQKKRHIAIDGDILCEPKFTNTIRQRGANGYNSLSISGVPTYQKPRPDTKYSHTDGTIDFAPLEKQNGIIQKSICKKCLTKYSRLFE